MTNKAQGVTGTVAMADGTRRDARMVNGKVQFATFGNANSTRGHSYRTASKKQAETFQANV